MELNITNIYMKYYENGNWLDILDDINMDIDSGSFVSIIGPSGCGKSTLCNLIAGLEKPEQGDIKLNAKSIVGIPGNVGYMPQKDLLLPWRTLVENVTLGADILRLNKQEARKEAGRWLEQFGLEEFANHYPHQLSGGMRQRGALLRTILFGKNILLLDEPFGALDALTRREMQAWLLSLWDELRHTVLFITHDIEEAILLSNKIIVLSHRPAHIVDEIEVDFPYPRSPELLLTEKAVEYKKKLLGLLMEGEN